MSVDAIVPRHILMFKTDDNAHFLAVGIDKIDGKWVMFGNCKFPLSEYDGWLAFLRGEGHTIRVSWDLDRAQRAGVPVIAVKPGATFVEAVEGAAWWWCLLLKEEKSRPTHNHEDLTK